MITCRSFDVNSGFFDKVQIFAPFCVNFRFVVSKKRILTNKRKGDIIVIDKNAHTRDTR